MPKIDVYNVSGEVVGNIDLKEEIFGINPNKDAMHIAVHNQLANRRQGTQSTKTKSEVRGGGIKPWRQKGTGRARQGSIRSAQWIKGGIVLGPKPRSYRYTIPKKLKRLALKSALSSKVSENDMLVLDSLTMVSFKTKQIVGLLSNLKVEDSVLIVIAGKDEKIENSARNIPGVKTALVNTINVFDILKYNKFIITKDAVSKVEEVYV
jgi:large subunit ribosomal protein L4